jgi:undecaprenyl-diphosphatase
MIITSIDRAISQWISALEYTPATTTLIVSCAEFTVYVVMIGFLVYLFNKKRLPRESMFALWVLVGAFVIRQVVKSLAAIYFLRDRPFKYFTTTPLVEVPGAEVALSFPSGHTLFLAAIAGAIFYKSRRLGWLLLAVTLITGVARVFARVHWPSDIVGGLVIGFAGGYLSSFLFGVIRARHAQYVHEKNARRDNLK